GGRARKELAGHLLERLLLPGRGRRGDRLSLGLGHDLLARTVAHAPDVDLQTLDLLDQDQDRLAGRAELVAPVRAETRPPAPQRLELFVVQPAAHLGAAYSRAGPMSRPRRPEGLNLGVGRRSQCSPVCEESVRPGFGILAG